MKIPLSIRNVIPQVVKKMGVTTDKYVLLSLVEKELHAIHPGIEIMAFKNNKIYAEVESSVYLYELNIRKREILNKIDSISSFQYGKNLPELQFCLKGTARPNAEDRVKIYNRGNPTKEPKPICQR